MKDSYCLGTGKWCQITHLIFILYKELKWPLGPLKNAFHVLLKVHSVVSTMMAIRHHHGASRDDKPWFFQKKDLHIVECRYLCYDKLEGTSSWSVNITIQHPDFWYLQDFVLQVLAAGHITMLFRSIGVPNNTTIPHRFPLRTRITLGRFQGDFAHCFWTAEWVYRKHSECGFSQDFLWYEPTQRHGDRRPQLPSNFIEHFPLKSLQVPWLVVQSQYCQPRIHIVRNMMKYVINDHPTIQKMVPDFSGFSFKAGIESAVYMAYEESVGPHGGTSVVSGILSVWGVRGIHPREIEWFDLFLCFFARVGFWILAWSEYHLRSAWIGPRREKQMSPCRIGHMVPSLPWLLGVCQEGWRSWNSRGVQHVGASNFSQVIQQLGDDPNASYDLLNVGGGKAHRCPEKTWKQKKESEGMNRMKHMSSESWKWGDIWYDDWLIIYVASNIQVLQSISGAVPDVFEAK